MWDFSLTEGKICELSFSSDEVAEFHMKWISQILINLLIGRSYLSLVLLLLIQHVNK